MRTSLLFLFLSVTALAWAGSPVSWSFAATPASGDTVAVDLTAVCEPGWHIYALSLPSDEGPLPTEIILGADTTYRMAGPTAEPAPEEKDDPNFGMRVRFHTDTVHFVQPVLRLTTDAFDVSGQVVYMTCNDKTCLPPVTVPFHLDIPALR